MIRLRIRDADEAVRFTAREVRPKKKLASNQPDAPT
jgi:hypothetical protein